MNKLYAKVGAIVVTYNPDNKVLQSNLIALLSQVDTVIVVDNGSNQSIQKIIQGIESDKLANITLLPLENNCGLGEAYNAGIAIAQKLKMNFVLLMDQDSILESGMVRMLYNTYHKLVKQGKRVGVVGPRYKDCVTNKLSSFVRVTQFGLRKLDCKGKDNFIRTDFLISSGSLIPINVLNIVGKMDDSLFIDHIDTEWCFRAQSKSFEIYGVCNAYMTHSLGNQRIRIWLGRWRVISFHKPFRYYYIFRNSFLLWQRPYLPKKWKRADKLRIIFFLFFFSIFSPNRIANLRMMLKGFRDGFKGKAGKLE